MKTTYKKGQTKAKKPEAPPPLPPAGSGRTSEFTVSAEGGDDKIIESATAADAKKSTGGSKARL